MIGKSELFQPEFSQLALPGQVAGVFIDGALCEDLEPVEVIRGSWPEFGWAKFTCNPGARQDTSVLLSEQVEDWFATGRSIRLCQLYGGAWPDVGITSLPLFVGQIESIETRMDGNDEMVEIIAKDYSAILQRITVYGQHVLQNNGSTTWLYGLETIFNPLGRGNAAANPGTADSKIHTTFCADVGDARMWNCAEVINYLLGEHLRSRDLYWPDVAQLLALTEGRAVQHLDVTGLSLLEALQRCCGTMGLRFCFVPRLAETGPSQAIIFYRNGRGRAVELNCQQAGEVLSLSRTSIGSLHSRRELYPTTHRYLGQGDFKVYEATFELIKAWDPSLEDISYGKFSASTNPEFYKVKDVYRRWCLNEAGDYTNEPYNQGEPFDFSRVFEQADYVHRRRRFWPALSTNAQGKSLGYFLQVSFDDGLHWWTYLSAFNNLLDECGIWLSSDQLDVDTWVAALKGGLRFRITACVVSDERLTCVVADGPVGSAIPVTNHILTLPRQFRYRKVSSRSAFAQTSGPGCGAPDEVDDSAALHQFVRQHAMASPAVIETTQVQTPTLMLHLLPGDRVVTSPESRDLLRCERDSRSTTWIDRVHMDFRNQCTNLQLVRQRMYEG